MLKSFKRQTHTQTDRQTDGYPVAELFSTVLETMGLAWSILSPRLSIEPCGHYFIVCATTWGLLR